MLKSSEPIATVPVRDFGTARNFYETKLGLTLEDAGMPNVGTFRSDHGALLVYQSEFAGTNQATAVTWVVGTNIGETVEALKAKGITFESYDIPGAKKEGDVYTFETVRTAWFKDPDGNIHALVNG